MPTPPIPQIEVWLVERVSEGHHRGLGRCDDLAIVGAAHTDFGGWNKWSPDSGLDRPGLQAWLVLAEGGSCRIIGRTGAESTTRALQDVFQARGSMKEFQVDLQPSPRRWADRHASRAA